MGLAYAGRSVKDDASRESDPKVGINLRKAKRYLYQLLEQLNFIVPPADVFIRHLGDQFTLMLVFVVHTISPRCGLSRLLGRDSWIVPRVLQLLKAASQVHTKDVVPIRLRHRHLGRADGVRVKVLNDRATPLDRQDQQVLLLPVVSHAVQQTVALPFEDVVNAAPLMFLLAAPAPGRDLLRPEQDVSAAHIGEGRMDIPSIKPH